MTNALKARASQAGGGNGGGGGYLSEGQERTVYDAQSGRTWIIRRTRRAYAYDLADAYNEGLGSDQKARGMQWIAYGIAGSEQIKLVTLDEAVTKSVADLKARTERDRLSFNARANIVEDDYDLR